MKLQKKPESVIAQGRRFSEKWRKHYEDEYKILESSMETRIIEKARALSQQGIAEARERSTRIGREWQTRVDVRDAALIRADKTFEDIRYVLVNRLNGKWNSVQALTRIYAIMLLRNHKTKETDDGTRRNQDQSSPR